MKARVLAFSVLLAGLPAVAPSMVQAAADSRSATLSGSYLAGRFAHQHDDWSAAARYITNALTYAPADRTLMQRAVIYRLGDGRTDAAAEMAQKLFASGDYSPPILALLSVDAVKKGQFKQASAYLEKLQGGGMWSLATPLLRAWIAAGEKDPDKALAALEPLAGSPGLAALRDLHAALILEQHGRGLEAGKLYDKLTATQAPLRLVQLAGNFYHRAGRVEDARKLYDRFAKSNPDSVTAEPLLASVDGAKAKTPAPALVPDARRGLAAALFDLSSALHQEQLSETALLLGRMALHLDPGFAVARLNLGDILASRQQAEAALTEYRALERDVVVGRAARLRAAEALVDLKREDEAVAMLTALSDERRDLIDATARLGDLHRVSKRWDAAVAAYDEAFRRIGQPNERHWHLLFSRAVAHERAGRWEKAEADLAAALKFQPDDASVLNYLGYSWIDRGERLDEAKAMVKRAVELRPRDGYIVDSLGWAHYKLGEYQEAVAALERAVELRPMDATINDHLGDAYWKVGRKAEARFQWLRASRMTQEDEQTLKVDILRKLEEGLPAAKTADADGKAEAKGTAKP